MPKRTDIKKILIVGAGPIIIGQACEFDYSGTQACKALKEEGYEVILVNSNPASIMTDPEFANKTYIEPITPEYVTKIIEKEKPDAMLPTMGGQTSLNIAVALSKDGTLEKHGVELIGAKLDAIEVAEDRELFKDLMNKIGLKSAKSKTANTLKEAQKIAKEIGFPLILRPAFTLGGTGGGIAYNEEEFERLITKGLTLSPTSQVLVEQSILGWKEFEMEVMRDHKDNVVIICSIENFDPMGVHTGDSITVAPIQTLSDKEFQALRNATIEIIRAVGIETGGCNVQFALNPENGEIIVIEMNPRVSRSSALASKATGFPIAKIAAKLSVGYSLDEIPNDITKTTMASFEPSLDYVVTKIPRFAFEKFPRADDTLNTQMKSVGETMAIGRTFKESFQKALRSLETGLSGFKCKESVSNFFSLNKEEVIKSLKRPNPKRVLDLYRAFLLDMYIEEVYELTKIDKWFLAHLKEIVKDSKTLISMGIESSSKESLLQSLAFRLKDLKSKGFSDKQIAGLISANQRKFTEKEIRDLRKEKDIQAVYKTIDTCAGEFESFTPYHYSSYDEEDEVKDSDKDKVIIIGGGPNRIGQGIEFDYCCVHAAQSLNAAGYETIMINNNPETVSTDYDTSDRLYFEPITVEDVLAIWNKECQSKEPLGVIVQLGGQTPLNIAKELEENGVKVLGTSTENIDLAEDRERFGEVLDRLDLKQTPNGITKSKEEAIKIANRIGYPVVVRPSYVLGGRGMGIVFDDKELNNWLEDIMGQELGSTKSQVILIDKFLEQAIEVDLDAVSDGKETVIAGIMEHIEYAGIHSGDSACVLPSQNLSDAVLEKIKKAARDLAKELKVIGLMNIQFAVKGEEIFILEANPRASRTVPFVSKATGIAWAKVASLCMLGKSLKEQGISSLKSPPMISVKEAVFSFGKFSEASVILGPEMKSTGEVMGISSEFSRAFSKAQAAASMKLPLKGNVFISVNDREKENIYPIAKDFNDLGFNIISTEGTKRSLEAKGLKINKIKKLHKAKEGEEDLVHLIKTNHIDLIINVPSGQEPMHDHVLIGQAAINNHIPIVTTITGAGATVKAIEANLKKEKEVKALQEIFN